MSKITRFEDFFNKKNEKEEIQQISGDEDITVELTPEEIQDMESEDDEELEEAADPLLVTSKDTMRIQDIVRKSEGNAYKAKALALTMCKLIKDRFKALRRARAAEREGQKDLADIFFKRATELGAMGA